MTNMIPDAEMQICINSQRKNDLWIVSKLGSAVYSSVLCLQERSSTLPLCGSTQQSEPIAGDAALQSGKGSWTCGQKQVRECGRLHPRASHQKLKVNFRQQSFIHVPHPYLSDRPHSAGATLNLTRRARVLGGNECLRVKTFPAQLRIE